MTFNNDSPDASQPTSPMPPISTQKNERSGDTTSISHTFNSRRLPRPLRYPPALLRSRRPLFLSLGIVLVLAIIVGMTVTVFSHPALTSVTRTPTASKTLRLAPTPTTTPTPMPTATPSPTPTPTTAPIPTSAPTPAPTPTPLVLPTTQTYVLCNPNSLTTNTAQLSTFGGDVADNCGGQFFYNSLPTSMQEHYILSLSLPAGEAIDLCNIYGFIPSIHASAQNMRSDLFVNGVWLGWKGGTISENSLKGWQDMGLTYGIHATGQVTIDVQVSDSTDQSGELTWPTMKFACRMVST